jgi:hypothetical protein
MKLSAEQKAANKLARQEAKATAKKFAQIEADKNQKPVNLITFSIEWSKAHHPTCTAKVHYTDGTAQQITARAGGWGYCKESTVIANIFNASLKYAIYQLKDPGKVPYGINLYNDRFYFAGGVGTSCYYQIAEFIGGKFERVASGKTYDAFRFTFNN